MDNLVPPRYTPPFLVVPIPLNIDGGGPETDPARVYGMVWEVWDSLNQTVEIYDTEEAAWAGLRALTIEYGTGNGSTRSNRFSRGSRCSNPLLAIRLLPVNFPRLTT